MPKQTHNPIREAVGSVLCAERLEQLARECGAMKRQRKIDLVALVAAVVCGFATGAQRSLAGMRRVYEQATGQSLAPSGFYARFSRELALLLKQLAQEAIGQLQAQTPRLRQSLARFSEVLVADGSLIQLHRSLAKAYPSVFPNKVGAAAKLHVVINVVGRNVRSMQLAAGTRHESMLLKIGAWVTGKLLILDLAYRKGLLFKQIAERGGFYLLRKRVSDNPIILDAPWCGRRFSELSVERNGPPIDVRILMPWRRSRRSPWHKLEGRLVGQWHPSEQCYFFYLTNAPPEMLATEHVAPIYAARWEVELFFRELKLTHRLEELPTRKRFVAEALIYAALLSLLLSRRLYSQLRLAPQRFAPERWARLFATFALDILRTFLDPTGTQRSTRRLIRVLRREAPDPNRNRPNLLARVQQGRFRLALN